MTLSASFLHHLRRPFPSTLLRNPFHNLYTPSPPQQVLHLQCAGRTTFATKLHTTTMVPIGVSLLALIVGWLSKSTTTVATYLLQMLFILVPPTATVVCSVFAVSSFDNGDGTFDHFMTADLSLKAEGPEYDGIIAYAWLMVVVWVIGMPLGLGVLLWLHRHQIESRRTRRGGPEVSTVEWTEGDPRGGSQGARDGGARCQVWFG